MKNPKLLRHIALYGISLPTFAVSPAVAKATVYMPSHIAARMLGGRAPRAADIANDETAKLGDSATDTSRAAMAKVRPMRHLCRTSPSPSPSPIQNQSAGAFRCGTMTIVCFSQLTYQRRPPGG